MKIKRPDRLDYWSIGHLTGAMICGMILRYWNTWLGLGLFIGLLYYEFLESYLTDKGIKKILFIPLDQDGISILDLIIDVVGFGLFLVSSHLFRSLC